METDQTSQISSSQMSNLDRPIIINIYQTSDTDLRRAADVIRSIDCSDLEKAVMERLQWDQGNIFETALTVIAEVLSATELDVT